MLDMKHSSRLHNLSIGHCCFNTCVPRSRRKKRNAKKSMTMNHLNLGIKKENEVKI